MELDSLYITELEEVLRFRSRAGDVTRIVNRRCAAVNAPISGRAILRTEQQVLPLDRCSSRGGRPTAWIFRRTASTCCSAFRHAVQGLRQSRCPRCPSKSSRAFTGV